MKIFQNIVIIILLVIVTPAAFAHQTFQVEDIEIEVGWGDEPPVVGFRNFIVIEISNPGEVEGVKSGIKNAFKELQATAKFGGVSKQLDIITDPKPGHYSSKIIPTRTGSIIIEFNGKINDVEINNIEVQIEDVEDTAVLDFPPTSGSSSDQDIIAMKNALGAIQSDVNELKNKFGDTNVNSKQFDPKIAYNFAMIGMSIGVAGLVLAVISMIKHKTNKI